jgi:hypothetical protein
MSEAIPATLIENKQVMLCLPFYKTTNPRTLFALMTLFDKRRMALSLDFGDAFVAHSRNKLADQFLRSGMEWCLMCDDDNVPPFGNADLYNQFTGFNLPKMFAGLHGIDRLLSHGKTLVGGLYRGRWPHSKSIFAEGVQLEKYVNEGPRDELRPTQWVGFGWVLIHRSVFLDIEKKFPRLARKTDGTGSNFFTSSEHDLVESVEEALTTLYNLSDDNLINAVTDIRKTLEKGLSVSQRMSNLGVGEDVQFCRRAAQAGHQTFVDMGLVVGHLGEMMYLPGKTKIS